MQYELIRVTQAGGCITFSPLSNVLMTANRLSVGRYLNQQSSLGGLRLLNPRHSFIAYHLSIAVMTSLEVMMTTDDGRNGMISVVRTKPR